MPIKPTEILAEIIELTQTLPTDPADYAVISSSKRRAIRGELEGAILRLAAVGKSLDLIRQPKHIFDPTSPKIIGDLVAHALLAQDRELLADAVKQPFYGAGVYAIYYAGPFDCYAPISGKEHPIYVGKADPDALHASSPEEQGVTLCVRLKDHIRTIGSADNLSLSDFHCRYLVVRSAWVETAEDLLIHWFRPVWNKQMKVCQGFGKHGDNADTRANKRSPWDTLHAGRAWATSEGNVPGKKTVREIRADIAEHYKKHPPKNLAVADTLTTAERSERMSRVRSSGNRATELRLMSLMREHGITGWRRGVMILGKPDFVFRSEKVAVFVDGCFWHGCPRHRRIPKSRLEFWTTKLSRNAKRDRDVTRTLRAAGWKVLRVWECSLIPSRARLTLARITRALEAKSARNENTISHRV